MLQCIVNTCTWIQINIKHNNSVICKLYTIQFSKLKIDGASNPNILEKLRNYDQDKINEH